MSRPLRVLAVDDCEDTASVLAILLRLMGHDVRLAHDGPEAIALAQEEPPDVILLDLLLPGMNGFEVARALRRQPGLHGVHLIALTGCTQDRYLHQATEAGFDHYLIKPVEPELLEELLMTIGSARSVAGDLAETAG
jgi:CheY-like chemotaxis protein